MIPVAGGAHIQPAIPVHPQQVSTGLAAINRTDHWKIERIIAVAMLAIIPGSFVFDSVFMNYLLAASLAIHAHWGLFFSKIFYRIIIKFFVYRNGYCIT